MIVPIKIPNPDKVFTPVFNKLWNCDKRFVVNYGGTGSSKSFSAAQKEILKSCQYHSSVFLVLRKVGSTLRDSVIPSFQARIKELKLNRFFSYNKTDRELTNTVTGTKIVFRGIDDPEKLKSFEGIQRIMLEEATEFELDDFLEINRRARGLPDIQITINFNPIHEEHWLKKRFFDKHDADAGVFKSTYLDNPFLTQQDREQIEWLKEYDYNQYCIYALGHWGITKIENPWLHAFDVQKHTGAAPFYPAYPVYLSFDFNREPLTCVAAQMSPEIGLEHSWLHFIKEFSEDIQLEELCGRIKQYFPNSILFVTGDASGRQGDIAFSKRNESYYTMIKRYLGLTDRMMHINESNLHHNDSRNLCNLMFYKYPKIMIDKERCPKLISDCQKAELDIEKGEGRIKKDRETRKLDLFDGMRYMFQSYYLGYVNKVWMGQMKVLKKVA